MQLEGGNEIKIRFFTNIYLFDDFYLLTNTTMKYKKIRKKK